MPRRRATTTRRGAPSPCRTTGASSRSSRRPRRAAPATCRAASAGIAPTSRCPSSAHSTGQHVRLVFHGVYKNADVWVNGYHLGGRPSGYAQFSFDLTEILSYAPDDDLVVSVRVDHTDISDSPLVQRLGHHPAGRARGARAGARGASTAPRSRRWRRMPRKRRSASSRPSSTTRHRPWRCASSHELRSLTSGRVHEFGTEIEVPPAGSADAAVDRASCREPELWSDTAPAASTASRRP